MSVTGSPVHAQAPTLASEPLPRRVRALLEGILEYTSGEIERTVGDTINEFEQQLFKLAEQARSPTLQNRWLEAQRMVKRTRPDLIPRFLIALEAELASIRSAIMMRGVMPTALYGTRELALVDEREMEETSALSEIASRTEVQNSLPLYLLGQRFGVLAGKPAFDAESLPVGPQAFLRMLRQAIGCLELGSEHRLLFYRAFERQLTPVYTGFIEALNTSLAKQGILPNLQYVPVRIRPYGPASTGATTPAESGGRGSNGAGSTVGRSDDGASSGLAGGNAGQNRYGTAPLPTAADTGTSGSAPQDAFLLMRQLLAGRRQLLGKLGTARSLSASNTEVMPTHAVLSALGGLQRRSADATGNQPASPHGIAHLKQDLLVQLRRNLPDQTAPTLAEEDNDSIDLVGMLFDHLMKDVRPQSPASALLAKLQAPLLRVALQDKSFFTRQQHPARQMLNAIAETGAHWLDAEDADPALVATLQALVDRTVRDYDGDVGLFNHVLDDLTSHLQTVTRKAEVAEKRQVEAARGKEKLALARQSAASVVESMLKKQNLPRFTHTLLSQAWTDVLALTALRHGEDSETWQQQLEIARRLIQVAKPAPDQPPVSSEEAESLRADIQSALSQVGYHEQEANAIAQRLINPQGGGPDEDGASRTELTMRLKARARLGSEKDDPKTSKTRLSASALAHLEQIKHLPFGTWFEFSTDQQGGKVRRRLSWFSTVTSHVLLVNHRGQKVGEYTLESLARAMAQGQAKVVEEEKGTLIDRAWNAVMGALRSFAGQKPSDGAVK